MMVWMDEEPMDVNKSFFIKQTTNLSRTRIDTIKYKDGRELRWSICLWRMVS